MKRFWIRLIASLPLADTVILIQNGRVDVKRGKVRTVLLAELAELSKAQSIEIACITADATPNGFRLSFVGIPKGLHQRFRNVWGANWA